jgi:hypothetical protein
MPHAERNKNNTVKGQQNAEPDAGRYRSRDWILSVLVRSKSSFRHHGIKETALKIWRALARRLDPRWHRQRREWEREQQCDREFDRRHGVDTRGDIPLERLGIPAHDIDRGHGLYRPIWGDLFNEAMALLPIRHEDFVFVDYGSGKGKALLLAANYPFRKIVGVDFSRLLHVSAVANIGSFRSPTQRCRDITAVCGDAMQFEPPQAPLVCFFFNPFDAPTWRKILDRLRVSWGQTPRDIFIVYVNIRSVRELGGVLDEFTFLSPLTKKERVLIYRSRVTKPRPPLSLIAGESRKLADT